VISINQIIAWSADDGTDCVDLGAGQINASVRNLRRSIEFYGRVFGFSTAAIHGARGVAVMKATARAELVLRERRDGLPGPVRSLRRWGFVVTNLDRVRQAVWEFGVHVARDSGEPDHIFRWSNRRSLYVHDPDGNEIELVEAQGSANTTTFVSEPAGTISGVKRVALRTTPVRPVDTATYCLPPTAYVTG
jgi:catechol 2,3-dioxygenase-like lactoylglutathione lyase family enzyme